MRVGLSVSRGENESDGPSTSVRHVLVFTTDGAVMSAEARGGRNGVEIGAARLAQHGEIIELFEEMLKRRSPVQVVPERTVASGKDLDAWWVPSKIRPMWFSMGKTQRSMKVRWPTLLFVVHHQDLYLYALATDGHPAASADIFHAPLMNIGADGLVCRDARDRKLGLEASRAAHEASVFDTNFSHINHQRTLKRGNKPTSDTDLMAFWRGRVGIDKPLPANCLNPLKRTLDQLMKGNS